MLGLGWSEFATKFSSKDDENVGSVAHLTEHLTTILKKETARRKAGSIPTEAATPAMAPKTMKQLGSPTEQVTALANTAELTGEHGCN